MKSMLILIAGPVRSGTDGNERLIQQNLDRMAQFALDIYAKGHIPVIGEWLALPLAQAAGSKKIGDEISETFLYPVAHRLLQRCDAILRLSGTSEGADNDVRIGKERGLPIYPAGLLTVSGLYSDFLTFYLRTYSVLTPGYSLVYLYYHDDADLVFLLIQQSVLGLA